MADQRHGVAVAALANINRNSEHQPRPYVAEDFIHWRDTDEPEAEADTAPTLIDDPVAQSNLIRAAMFGLPPR